MRKNEDYKIYYKLEKKLGKGKFGEVFEAIKKDTNEKRAIKILSKNKIRNAYKNQFFKEPNEEEMKPYIECFLNEIRNMKLALGENEENQNAVKFYEYFDNKNEFVIVMEKCDNSLLKYLDKIKEEEKHRIINQLNKTIKIMVENKLIYIDLRLENILIKYTNEEKTQYIIKLKLTDDIGLVKQFRNLFNSVEESNTINCIDAPEILKEKEYTHKSDLWSLGVIIYVLYFNDYPYRGNSEEELLNDIKKGQRNLKKSGNIDLDNLIRGLLIEEPEERMDWNQYFDHPFFVKKKIKNEDFKNHYKIEKEIANVGYATVYRARSLDTDELRAIKVFDKTKVKDYLKRKMLRIPSEEDIKPYINGFLNEIKYMKIIEGENNKNNNTVKYYENYQSEDKIAIVMELCDSNLLNLFIDRKIVHLALNLDNILVKYENKERTQITYKLKLTNDSCLLNDLSKALNINQKNENIFFLSPEILRTNKVDEKCDLWSLGIIIYTLAFMDYPFKGDTTEEILSQVKKIDSTIKAKTDNYDLDDLIKKLLKEDPKNRLTWKQYFNHRFIRQKENVRNYYEIEKIIGQSRFAHIYKARVKESNELRAIKIYDKDRIRTEFKRKNFRDATDEDLKPYIIGFNNEINNMKIVEGKDQKNIYTVKFYEHFHTKDEFAIVMELCDDNLLSLFAKKNFSFEPKRIQDILNLLNHSFKIMVQNKIVHRALNLENILVKFKDKQNSKYVVKLKLTDDSLVKDLPQIKTKEKINSGLFFIAPEILEKKFHNEECDLWSLGIIIYALSFKDYPFKGNDSIEILNEIRKIGNNFKNKTNDSKLNDLISRLLIEDPNKRITWNQYFNHPFFGRNEIGIKNFHDLYEIGKIIGYAGFATVYKAKLKGSNEERAIKIFDKNKIRSDYKIKNIKIPTDKELKPYIDGFLNEANNMKILQGKNNENEYTVKFYEYYHRNDEFSIVMELCDDNLLNIFAKKKDNFNSDEIYNLLIQLNISFRIMAENGLIHRAINLENILIKYENKSKSSYIIKLKLTHESCLLKNLSDNRNTKIQSDLNYIAPEILNREDYNERCDLWSLGVVIYILTFREHPYPGDTEYEILQEINLKKNNIKRAEDNYLDDLIQRLLVKDPENRLTWEQYFNHSFFRNRGSFTQTNTMKRKKFNNNYGGSSTFYH